jgi:hypothetical protein
VACAALRGLVDVACVATNALASAKQQEVMPPLGQATAAVMAGQATSSSQCAAPAACNTTAAAGATASGLQQQEEVVQLLLTTGVSLLQDLLSSCQLRESNSPHAAEALLLGLELLTMVCSQADTLAGHPVPPEVLQQAFGSAAAGAVAVAEASPQHQVQVGGVTAVSCPPCMSNSCTQPC